MLRPKLADYFARNIYAEVNQQLDDFFHPPVFNNMSNDERRHFQRSILTIPMKKPTDENTSAGIVEMRKTYARSHEPWDKEEISLFHLAVDKTNDINFLTSAFQRSPNSIKASYEQMLKQKAVSEE